MESGIVFKFGFFNAVDGDRVYNTDDLSEFYYGLISDGVLASPITSLQVTASDGMKVSVASGRAMIRCKYFINTDDYVMSIDAADNTNPRIDRIVLRMDAQNRFFDILCRKGTAAVSPSAPALIRTDSIYELSLAQIYVEANAAGITPESITDERENDEVCGYIKAMIDADTSALQAQIDDLKRQVAANTAALNGHSLWSGTQAEYDALGAYGDKTEYMIDG